MLPGRSFCRNVLFLREGWLPEWAETFAKRLRCRCRARCLQYSPTRRDDFVRGGSSGARPLSAEFWVAIYRGERSLAATFFRSMWSASECFRAEFHCGERGGRVPFRLCCKTFEFFFTYKILRTNDVLEFFAFGCLLKLVCDSNIERGRFLYRISIPSP